MKDELKKLLAETPYLKLDWRLSFVQKCHYCLVILLKTGRIWTKWKALPPEYRKSFWAVVSDFYRLVLQYDVKIKDLYIKQYFTGATWRQGCDLEHYVIWEEWDRLRCWQDQRYRELVDILGSKERLPQYWAQYGIPVVGSHGTLLEDGGVLKFQRPDGSLGNFDALLAEKGGVFVKPDMGMQGCRCAVILPGRVSGCYRIKGEEQGVEGLSNLVQRGPLKVEQLVSQHSLLAALHPSSVNTLRLITLQDEREGVKLVASVLRIGVGGRGIDNWSAGGIAVRIKDDGCLDCEGWYKGGGICVEHPDTHIIFEGYEVPFFHEAVEMVLRGHRTNPAIFGIGWDVAITPDGLILVETNTDFGIGLLQYFYGGVRELMETQLRPLAEEVRRKYIS